MTAAPKGYVALDMGNCELMRVPCGSFSYRPSPDGRQSEVFIPYVGSFSCNHTAEEIDAKLAAALGEQGAGDDAGAWKALAANWRDLGLYGFADGHGHPLTNCAPFIAIGRLAESRGVAPKPAAPARAVEPEVMVHHAEQLETARRALLNVPFAEPVRQAICAMDNAQAALRRIARGGA